MKKKSTNKVLDYASNFDKKGMVKVARQLGWRGDPERQTKQQFIDLLQSYDYQNQREALYALGWQTDEVDSIEIDESDLQPEQEPEALIPEEVIAEAEEESAEEVEERKPAAKSAAKKAAPASPSRGADVNQIAAMFAQLMEVSRGQLSEEQVREIAQTVAAESSEELAEAIMGTTNLVTQGFADLHNRINEVAAKAEQRPATRLEVVSSNGTHVIEGKQHKQFPKLLKALTAKNHKGQTTINVWLTGMPGTGKTTAAENCASALGMKFYTNGSIANKYELTGFIDAHGNLVRTPFRDAWEHGGVYLFDEVDGSNPNAVLAFNAALANGLMAFPDGMVKRNPNCIVIAAANTMGQGATARLIGRLKQDEAFLDRFVFMTWVLDEELERSFVPDEHGAWVEYVQQVRGNVARKGISVLVTPRASVYGSQLLAAGMDMMDVIEMTLKKGMTDDQWSMVK